MKTKLFILMFTLLGLTVNAQLVVSVNSATICAGKCATLTASPSGGTSPYNYVWNPAGQTTQTIVVCPTFSTTYTVTVMDATSSTATATASVTVNPSPVANAGSDATLCSCGTMQFSGSGGGTYAWSGPNSFSASSQNPTIVCITTLYTGTYTLVITNANGCTGSDNVTLTVKQTPAAPTAGSNSPVNPGNNLSLTASTVSGATYNWSGPNSFTSSSQNPVIVAVSTVYAGCYSVTATVNGCTSPAGITCVTVGPTAVQEINPQSEIIISPNPNNGTFVIKSETKQSQIEIYNVYGEKIISMSPSGGGAGGGITINLSDQPSGIYFLQLKTEQGIIAKKIILNK